MLESSQIGETSLKVLLQNMEPELQDGEYVFCSIDPAKRTELNGLVIGQFMEVEGLTVIVKKTDAEANCLVCSNVFKMISLKIHSSLNAVGFLAVITQNLAAQGICVNVVSAFFHDHLFVPVDHADEAMMILKNLSDPTN